MRLAFLALCLTGALMSGCDREFGISKGHGADPGFDPVAFFSGHTQSWGVIESRSGAPTQQITTVGQGASSDANRLLMKQYLTFEDGTTQQRDWTLWRTGPNRFDATANDMVGTANGETNGRIFHWQWILARAPGNHLMNVTINQWMYGLDDGSVMIRTNCKQTRHHPGGGNRTVYACRKRSGGQGGNQS